MAKRLFLLLLSSLIGVISSPSFLTADNALNIKQPEFNAVNTVEIVKEEPETVVYQENVPAASSTPVLAVQTIPVNNIAIAGRTLEIINVESTAIDSGNHVNKYGNRFLYGHNTGAVFGGLSSLGVGSIFTVTEDSVKITYRVQRVVIFEKNVESGRLQINGEGNYMRPVANATMDGVQYDLSIMTCYGTSYGNGDASHRLVLFADAV